MALEAILRVKEKGGKREGGHRSVTKLTNLVPTLFLAHLTVPSQLLQSLGFDAIGDGLGRKKPVLGHFPDL